MSRSRQEEKEFEELQRRKKRRMQERRRREAGENMAKSYNDEPVKKRKKKRRPPEPVPEPTPVPKKGGNLLVVVQLLASILFIASLVILNMLPMKFLLIIGGVLLLLVAAAKFLLRPAKEKKGAGRAFSLIMSAILLVGSFYVLKTFGAVISVSGEGQGNNINVNKEPYIAYISGIDVYGEIEKESRSDVNMLAVVNPKTEQILLVTTPRDYYVDIPGVTDGNKDKLTHAGLYGIEASMSTLEQLYDAKIDFHARVNFTSVIDMVDALGGIEVDSKHAFTTSKAAGAVVDIQEGKNKLNGEQALAFCRERKNLPDGDNERGKNQQRVIKGMLNKVMSPAILTGANGILNSVQKDAETNMSRGQIQSLIKRQLGGGVDWQVISVAAEGSPQKQYCYSYSAKPLYVSVPDQNSVAEITQLIQAVRSGDKIEDPGDE